MATMITFIHVLIDYLHKIILLLYVELLLVLQKHLKSSCSLDAGNCSRAVHQQDPVGPYTVDAPRRLRKRRHKKP